VTGTNDRRRGHRPLNEDEHAVWQGVTRSVTPLRRRPRLSTAHAEDEMARPAAPPAPDAKKNLVRTQPAPKLAAPVPAPLARRLKQRVARGAEPIDARIDLHGMTQAQAHHALLRFLRNAQADGARMVLVITGKGARGDEPRDFTADRGVLKRQVPLWLRLPEFRPLVVGFTDAGIGHGGEGALYVQVRRNRV
jgi:DNA-nicking Smr family endonuclease